MTPDGQPIPPGPPPPAEPSQQPRWNDPAAYAATAPPMTNEEREASYAGPPRAEPSQHPSDPSRLTPPPPRSGAALGPALDPEHVPPNAPRALAGFLVSFDGSELGSFWPIYQGRNEIGRKGAADGLHIEIDHPTTSSRHAVILASARPARIKLEDPGSTNGTFLESGKIEHGKKYELRDGEVIRFGAFSAIVKVA
jgi:pSer/pThr/pTyr-binding forkhead associated (FHA) protein